MSYLLVVWTIVGYAGTQIAPHEKWDWRPIGEFHTANAVHRPNAGKDLCEEAARQLNIPKEKFRCVRTK